MKVGDKVIAPAGDHGLIPAGRTYKVIKPFDGYQNTSGYFCIINDAGLRIFCLVTGCPHLQSGTNWIIKNKYK